MEGFFLAMKHLSVLRENLIVFWQFLNINDSKDVTLLEKIVLVIAIVWFFIGIITTFVYGGQWMDHLFR